MKHREPNLKISCRTVIYREVWQQLHSVYRCCISEWYKKLSLYTPADHCPLLTVKKEAFCWARVLSHEGILTESLTLGTLTSNTEFHEHVHFAQTPSQLEITTSFFHDTRYIEVHVGKYLVVLRYSSISHIVCDESEFTSYLYFYLINPATHYEISDKSRVRLVAIPGISPDTVGRSNTIKLALPKSVTVQHVVSRIHFRCGKIKVVFTSVSARSALYLPSAPNVDLGQYKCTYMFQALLLRSYVIELQNPGFKMDLVIEQLQAMASEFPDVLYQVLVEIMHMIDDGVFFNFVEAVNNLFQWHVENEEMIGLSKVVHYMEPPKSRYIWRITLTPTRKLLWPASIMLENRILRNFDSDYACRVSFRDDNNRKLSMFPDRNDDRVYYLTVQKPMTEGIRIGDRHLEFLGWSNSQIRDHGVWMYARDTNGNTARAVRAWMGDFSHIRSIPMFMARMGQCFSHSEESVNVPLKGSRVRTDPDIIGGKNPVNAKPYVFSDGVGRISEPLLNEVCKAMHFPNVPSALQIRYAGFKGMLVLDPMLQDVDIVFRESMNKFACSRSHNLEIVKTSSPVPVSLNRNLITILSQVGVRPGAILKLQEDILRGLTDFLLESQAAVDTLKNLCPLYELDYDEIARAGICPTMEPFFRSMLIGLHKKTTENIKKKARLEIPHSFGRNMFGVLDETGTLEYGQVFVKYTSEVNDWTSEKLVHTGPVMVTKNPCLQKGDVRMLEAVDVPALHHIVDCIVFPSKGVRPHPNEMAGSDLDGDEYAVIWYKPLFFKTNSEPSHFPQPRSNSSSKSFEVEDMVDFLCSYVKNDHIGVIGNTHLAKADELGLDHAICQSVARKFSVAVDLVKTGDLVILDKDERPLRYPDFMGKEYLADTYRSPSVLGKLYRVCQNFETEDSSTLCYGTVKVDTDLVVAGWESYRQQAIRSRDRYNRLLETLLSTYGVDYEPEAMTKALLSIHGRLQERRDKIEVEEIIQKSVKSLWKNMKKEFMEEFSGLIPKDESPLGTITRDILLKASAWYIVTYSDPNAKFLSFPWIVSRQLAQIKAEKLSLYRPPCFNMAVYELDQLLSNCIQYNPVATLNQSYRQLCLVVCPNLNWSSLELATRVLLYWAKHHELIKEPRITAWKTKFHHQDLQNVKKFEGVSFVYSFLNVIKGLPSRSLAMEMILCFLKKCISLRFLDASEARDHFPNGLSKFKAIGKKAMFTYHSLAISRDLASLGLESSPAKERTEDQEMDPVRLPWKLVCKHQRTNFKWLKMDLEAMSGVAEVRIRSSGNNGALLSASGTPSEIKKLKSVISKEYNFNF